MNIERFSNLFEIRTCVALQSRIAWGLDKFAHSTAIALCKHLYRCALRGLADPAAARPAFTFLPLSSIQIHTCESLFRLKVRLEWNMLS